MATERAWFQRALRAYLKLSPVEQQRLRRVLHHGPVGRLKLDDGLIAAGFIEPYPRHNHSQSVDLPPEELPSPKVIGTDLGLWWERFDTTPEWNDAVEEAISSRPQPSSF